ncbi:MAG TPA: aspartate aminotransferase family protein [Candidatus Omnitrophota bacterium]|nr:aspartate aminotransferase family protein [Candidatus Omnitrophota bacterium]HRZ66596.1 aspartate aminotransferase family protein [Candidatus Omnitrophota bacterium]
MTQTEEIMKVYYDCVMPTYARVPVVLVRGKGVNAYDIEGKEFLDFFPGWAVSGIGHCHPKVVRAIKEQAGKMIHVSNNFYNELQGKLAAKIIQHSFGVAGGKVFFCNSGAEANEAAIKLARRAGYPFGKYEIITMEGSFHGRTLAAITATAQPKYQEGFGPLPGGFVYAKFNDLESVLSKITDKTAAIMLEPIQGEGGINVGSDEFIKGLRKVCDEKKILLIFDEVQTGMGRTGKMFCYQHYGVTPDIMTLAKTLGGGFPIGAMVAGKEIADTLQPGMHASTFGGGPLACAASLATFEAIEEGDLVEKAVRRGRYLHNRLSLLKKDFPFVHVVRGKGLMQAVELTIEGRHIVDKCAEMGLLINCTQAKILRVMPPLTVKNSDIDKALGIIEQAMKGIEVES